MAGQSHQVLLSGHLARAHSPPRGFHERETAARAPRGWPRTGGAESHLLVRLFNETFVALPTSQCIELGAPANSTGSFPGPAGTPQDSRFLQEAPRPAQPAGSHLCILNWTQSEIISRLPDQSSPFLGQQHQIPQQQQQHPHHNHQHYQIDSSQGNENENETTARLLYLSSSSILSLVGVLTNFLILLIIVINTKQKCHNFLNRTSQTSHTNYHYVLLFQLTLTGLLLGGYVLLSSSSQLYYSAGSGHSSLPFVEDQLGVGLNSEPDGWDFGQVSPMSLYLPAPVWPGGTKTRVQRRAALVLISTQGRGEPMIEREAGEGALAGSVIAQVRCGGVDEAETSSESALGGENGSKIAATLLDLVASVHLWTVAALAYDRYCAIAYPLEYLRTVNAARTKTFLVVLWATSLLVNVFLPLGLAELGGLRGVSSSSHLGELASSLLRVHAASSPQHNLKAALEELSQVVGGCRQVVEAHSLALTLALSGLTFVLCCLVPLASVTICNLSIYGIVKVHERRLSASSGSQGNANNLACSGGSAHTSAAHSTSSLCHNFASMAAVASRFRLLDPAASSTNSFFHSFHQASRPTTTTSNQLDQLETASGSQAESTSSTACETETTHRKGLDETSSLASSILGKLIRSSARVGSLGGTNLTSRRRHEDLSCSSSDSSSSASREEICPEICNLIAAAAAADGDSCKSPELPTGENLARNLRESIQNLGRPREKPDYSQAEQAKPSASFVVNRLRRLGPGQAQRHHQDRRAKAASGQQVADGPQSSAIRPQAESRLHFFSRKKLKRKLSDKEQQQQVAGSAPPPHVGATNRSASRRSSFAPSEQSLGCVCGQQAHQPLLAESCPCGQQVAPRANGQQLDSEGILRQIKMAGLSFAGIAINELMQPTDQPPGGGSRWRLKRRPLNRSSSCSLGNLATASHVLASPVAVASSCRGHESAQAQFSNVSAATTSNVIAMRDKKNSYVSLNMRPDQSAASSMGEKYSTHLGTMNASDPSMPHHMHQQHNHLHHPQQHQFHAPHAAVHQNNFRAQTASCQQPQHFNLGGTKSVAFNVVVWLILVLLIWSLPQYCMLVLSFYRRRSQEGILQNVSSHLNQPPAPPQATGANRWLLSQACRLLFLLMLPLNAWLYGIRSKSLKTTLKMVLRRYISKKQASIEINQRRKSNQSTRSRDSSLLCRTSSRNSSLFCYQTQQQQQHQHPHAECVHGGRVFRRCASFNLPPVRHEQSTTGGDYSGRFVSCACAYEAPTIRVPQSIEQAVQSAATPGQRPHHNNSIRFVIGAEESSNTPQVSPGKFFSKKSPPGQDSDLAPASPRNCSLLIPSQSLASSQNSISLNSCSLASSNRSLLSASIQSSHSAALLLLDPAVGQQQVGAEQNTQLARQVANPKPLTSVLKKRDSSNSMMHHQDSCDSAPASANRPALDRVQSSPSKLVLVGSRRRSLDHSAGAGPAPSSGTPPTGASQTTQIGPSNLNPVGSTFVNPPTSQHNRRLQFTRQRTQEVQSSSKSMDEAEVAGEQRTDELTTTSHLRRPSSDIRLLLTSADENDQTSSQLVGGPTTTDLLEQTADDEKQLPTDLSPMLAPSGDRPVDELADVVPAGPEAQAAQQSQLDYYKQIKLAIVRYLFGKNRKRNLHGSAAVPAAPGRCSCEASRKNSDSSQFSVVSGLSNLSDRSMLVGVDECKCSMASQSPAKGGMAMRKTSLDSQVLWHNNKTHHHVYHQQEVRHHLAGGNARRGSHLSLVHNPLAASAGQTPGLAEASTSLDASHRRHHLENQQAAPHSSHLRPPNFLKLLLDSDNQQGTLYSSSLALSPIKETSSYASSNSSLNQQQNQQPARVETEEKSATATKTNEAEAARPTDQ